MNQVNILPLETSQGTDMKKDNSTKQRSSQDRDSGFSALVEQHVAADNRGKSDKKISGSGKETSSVRDISDRQKRPESVTDSSESVNEASVSIEVSGKQASQADGEATESTTESNSAVDVDTKSNTDKSKDPQALMELLGASAKLLQQEGEGEQDITSEEALDGSTSTSTSTKNKAANAQGTEAALNKLLSKQGTDGEVVDGAPDETKPGQTELTDKLKAAGGEVAAGDVANKEKLSPSAKSAESVENAESDKKLSPKKNEQAIKNSLLADKPAVETSAKTQGSDESQSPIVEDDLIAQAMSANNKPVQSGKNTGDSQKSVQGNKVNAELAKGVAAAQEAKSSISLETQALSTSSADAEPVIRDLATPLPDSGVKNSQQTQTNHSLGEFAASSQKSGKDSGDGQAKNSEHKPDFTSKDTEALNNASEVSSLQQDKLATSPLRDANTLSAQMNNSALATAATPEAHNSEFVQDTMANKLSTENTQTQKTAVSSLNETLNLSRKDFVDSMKEKVMIMVNQKIQQVEIRLDPPEMGNMHVRVNLQNEQAAISFLVQNQQTKEALEQNMGKLKEMLSESGVDVGDANVAQQQQGSESNEQQFGHQQGGSGGEDANIDKPDLVLQANMGKPLVSGIDYYA